MLTQSFMQLLCGFGRPNESITLFSFSIRRRALNKFWCLSTESNSTTHVIRRREIALHLCECGLMFVIHHPEIKNAIQIRPHQNWVRKNSEQSFSNPLDGLSFYRFLHIEINFSLYRLYARSITHSLTVSVFSNWVISIRHIWMSISVIYPIHIPILGPIIQYAAREKSLMRSYLLCPIHCTRIQ